MKKATKHIPMNLQLFADTQPSQADLSAQALAILQGGESAPQAAAPQGQPMPDGQANPQNNPQLQDNGGQVPGSQEGQTPNQVPVEGEPMQQAPQSQQEQLILGKFKSPDEVVNAYTSLEQFNTKTRQELAQERQEKEQLRAALEQMQQQQTQQMVQPQVQEPELSAEEINEQFMNKFYENPTATLQEMLRQMVEPQIAPIQQQYQQQQEQAAWNQEIYDFATSHQDFEQWKPAMQEVLNNPHIANLPNKLEVAYAMAKGQNYQDPNAMLQDQNFVKQNILGNQDIKNQIIQEYLQGLNKGQQAPTVIGGQVGGAMPMTPENQPTTVKEASNIALKMLRG